MVLRDKALAHFGDGNLSRSLSFAEDSLVLVGDTGRPRIHCLTKRGNIDLSIGFRLQKLLTEAISILVVASQEKAIAANKAVIDAVNNGILTFEELDQCHIDYFNLHPNEESAWDALANMDREHHFGHGIGSLD